MINNNARNSRSRRTARDCEPHPHWSTSPVRHARVLCASGCSSYRLQFGVNSTNINGDSLNWAGVNTFAFSSGQVPTDGAHEAERADKLYRDHNGDKLPATNFAG